MIVGGGENKNYVDILIKGALQTDKTTDPTPVNVVIPNNAIKWNTQYENKDIPVTLYYYVEDTVSASLETASGYFGTQASPITGIKYMPLKNGNGYEVKINLNNARFKGDLDKDAIASWFSNFTEMKNRKIEPRPLPTDRSYVLVNITGSLTSDVKYDSNSNVIYNQNVELVIPKEAIDAYLTEDVRLRLYYGTSGEVEAEIKADNIEFFGSQNSPISGVQYLPLGDSGNGVQVRIALKKAQKEYDLTDREKDIIKKHMWPLTVVPPLCREAWIVTTADKYCSLLETLKLRKGAGKAKVGIAK